MGVGDVVVLVACCPMETYESKSFFNRTVVIAAFIILEEPIVVVYDQSWCAYATQKQNITNAQFRVRIATATDDDILIPFFLFGPN